MKRLISLLLTVALLASCLSLTSVSAEENSVEYTVGRPEYKAYKEASAMSLSYSKEEMRDYFLKEITKCNETIDVSAYNIPLSEENFNTLANIIYYDIPEAFHVNTVSCRTNGEIITKITIEYACDVVTYSKLMMEVEAAALSVVSDIDTAALSDTEKALLIHDRLALICTYDVNYLNNDTALSESYGIYGALVEGQAICQGYSRAYMYLLDMVGIDSRICTSDVLNHMWNIIYIDGKPYHVDVTWDDPSFGEDAYNVAGYVEHYNFLRSTSGFYSSGHTATDYDSSPVDTTFDNYCWQNSTTAFQLVSDELYYVDNVNSKLMRFSDEAEILDVSHKWRANQYGFYNDNFTHLASDSENLLFSDSQCIYSYNINTGVKQKIHTAQTNPDKYIYIYGMKYSDGYIVYDLSDSPVFNNPGNISRISVLYDKVAPVVSARVTNEVDVAQTLRLNFSDNTGISGYYFGNSSNYTENPFVATEKTEVDIPITQSGEYYIVAADAFGNVSNAFKIAFIKTTLNPSGGTVLPEYIISCAGFEVKLPMPQKDGTEFLGWSDRANGTDFVSVITPVSDSEYFAVWKDTPVSVPVSAEIYSLPDKTEYFVGESFDSAGLAIKITMSDGSEQIVTSGITVTGFESGVVGVQTLTASVQDLSVDFEVVVKRVEPVALVVKKAPDKSDYFVGDTVDTSGLELALQYNNGISVVVADGFRVVNPVIESTDTTIIFVEYSGFVTFFEVSVAAVELSAIELLTLPHKTEYFIGEDIDSRGLSLLLTYSNGDKEITDRGFVLYGYNAGVLGEQLITVDVDGFTASFTVTVKKPEAISAEIISLPAKTEYKVGEILDLSGLKVKVVYDNGDEVEYSDNFALSGTVLNGVGENLIVLNFGESSVELTVWVSEIEISTETSTSQQESETTESIQTIPVISTPVSTTQIVTDNTEQTTDATEINTTDKLTDPVESTVATEAKTDPAESTTVTEVFTDPAESTTVTEVITDPAESTVVTDIATTSVESTDSTGDSSGVSESTAHTEVEASTHTDAEPQTTHPNSDSTMTTDTSAALPEESTTNISIDFIKGDANGDGKVNIKDATAIQKFIAKLIELDAKCQLAADVNSDVKINVKDVTTIQKYVAGIINKFD